ncbi:MAG TPA: hypothetical protein VFZ75_03555 [Actinomycetota bacterium]|nr:hypothetical protein [Actinomycetota bacterium]
MDEFQFGGRTKRPVRGSIDPRIVVLVTVLVVAGVLVYVFWSGADEGSVEQSVVSQVDRAYDSAAQGALGRAVVVALTMRSQQGRYPADLATLSGGNPTLTFTTGPSGDPGTVSYALGESGFAAAVRSESGTCWWVRIDAAGATSYGSGSSCTGDAAMAASDPTW